MELPLRDVVIFGCGAGCGAVIALIGLWILLIIAMRQPGGH